MSNQGVAEIVLQSRSSPNKLTDVQKAITQDYRELMSKMNLKIMSVRDIDLDR